MTCLCPRCTPSKFPRATEVGVSAVERVEVIHTVYILTHKGKFPTLVARIFNFSGLGFPIARGKAAGWGGSLPSSFCQPTPRLIEFVSLPGFVLRLLGDSQRGQLFYAARNSAQSCFLNPITWANISIQIQSKYFPLPG